MNENNIVDPVVVPSSFWSVNSIHEKLSISKVISSTVYTKFTAPCAFSWSETFQNSRKFKCHFNLPGIIRTYVDKKNNFTLKALNAFVICLFSDVIEVDNYECQCHKMDISIRIS